MISPSRTITAPKGPPPDRTLSSDSFIASRMKASGELFFFIILGYTFSQYGKGYELMILHDILHAKIREIPELGSTHPKEICIYWEFGEVRSSFSLYIPLYT